MGQEFEHHREQFFPELFSILITLLINLPPPPRPGPFWFSFYDLHALKEEMLSLTFNLHVGLNCASITAGYGLHGQS